MLIVELAFTESSERLAARPAHRALLARLHEDGRLIAAGPWANDTGAMLIFDVDSGELERPVLSRARGEGRSHPRVDSAGRASPLIPEAR